MLPGLYQLRIRLRQSQTIRVGASGRHTLPAGWYVYTGSAKNGLAQRIGRHLRRTRRKHWHIDYVLAVADDVQAFVLPREELTECELHAQLQGGRIPIPGFGSSDCACESHLLWFKKQPDISLTSWDHFVRDCFPY